MADYTPLIQRAVDGLESNTGENRRVLYERARVALTAQLRGMDPPLEESEITRERDENGGSEFEEAPVAPTQRSLTDEALAGFRETMAEADGLGDAAAQANKSARTFYAEEAGETESEAQVPEQPPGGPFEPQNHEAPPEELARTWQPPPPPPEEDEAVYRPRRSYGRLVTALIIVLL